MHIFWQDLYDMFLKLAVSMPNGKGGDQAVRKGEVFQNKIVQLLCDLGYQEETRKKYGLDFVATPPVKSEQLLRPIYSPLGKTAFEFRDRLQLQPDKTAEELNNKIAKINTNKRHPLKNIDGGVVITDLKLSPSIIETIKQKSGIYFWDSKIQAFLASKIFIKDMLAKFELTVLEERLDDWTTALWCLRTYRISNCLRMEVTMYYHNPYQPLDLENSDRMLNLLNNMVKDKIEKTKMRTYIGLNVCSVAGIDEDLERNFSKILKKHNNNLIIYEPEDAKLWSFESAFWYYFVSFKPHYE